MFTLRCSGRSRKYFRLDHDNSGYFRFASVFGKHLIVHGQRPIMRDLLRNHSEHMLRNHSEHMLRNHSEHMLRNHSEHDIDVYELSSNGVRNVH
jgi:hypothetical protein